MRAPATRAPAHAIAARIPATGTAAKAETRQPVGGDASPVEAVLDLQATAGNQAVVQLFADSQGAPPAAHPNGRRAIGNRAMASLLAGVAQRESPAASTGHTGIGAKPGKAKPKGKAPSNTFNSLVDLFNSFQDLAVAAVNRGGEGLEGIRFGRDLSPDHRYLLNRLRAVMVQGRSEDKEERVLAAQGWPWVSSKLQVAVAEATKLEFRADVLTAVNDAIAQVGTRYFRARPRASDPGLETFESYQDAIRGINELLFAFERMGESGEGIIREEVPKRKDVAVSMAVMEINKKQRDRLEKVKFGSHLIKQHTQALETLRTLLITARTETAGSAYKAWARWQKLEGTLQRLLKRTLVFGETDLGPVQQSIDRARETLASHYRAVHTQGLRTALTKERSVEEKKIDKTMGEALGPRGAAAIREARAVQDFRHALATIEHNVAPSPDRPGEWVLSAGGQAHRIRADQGMAIRDAARTQVREYMASLVTDMVQAWDTYDQIKRGTGSTRRKVLGFIGGADDPGDQSEAKNSIIEFRDKVVYKLADEGKFVAALEAILGRKGDVERRARAVGDYDTDLDKGYKRLAVGASVVQVALVSLIPVAGQMAMAPLAAGGVAASAWAAGGVSIAAGAGGAALGETGRQLAFEDEMDPGKIASTAKTGAVMGAGAVAPHITKEIAAFIAPAARGSTAVGANMAASSIVGGVHSYAGGGSGLQGAAGGAIGSMAGSLVNAVAPVANAPVTNMVLGGAAGGAVAYATDQDVAAGVVGGMVASAGDRALLKQAGGGGAPPPARPASSSVSGAGDTRPGLGFDGRGPATTPGAGDTLPGLGFDPPAPAAPPRKTLLGTGIDPMSPAAPPAGAVDPLGATLPGAAVRPPPTSAPPTIASPDALSDTMPMPAASTGPAGGQSSRPLDATNQGMSAPPDSAKMLGGQRLPRARVQPMTDSEVAAALHDNPTAVHRSSSEEWHDQIYMLDHGPGDTPQAIRTRSGIIVSPDYVLPTPRPGPALGPLRGSSQAASGGRLARLPEYAGQKPIMGDVGHVVDSAADASALYTRLHAEGQRNTSGTSDAGVELAQWRADGGTGDAPMAWIRAGDGVVRFNFSKFPRPNLGGHTTEPLGPIEMPATAGRPRGAPPAAPAGQPMIREWARLPEFRGAPPLFGPASKVSHVVTDMAEAQMLWKRLVSERQLHIHEHDADFAALNWSDDGGVGPVPIAWVSTTDGIIRFNAGLFRPTALVP